MCVHHYWVQQEGKGYKGTYRKCGDVRTDIVGYYEDTGELRRRAKSGYRGRAESARVRCLKESLSVGITVR